EGLARGLRRDAAELAAQHAEHVRHGPAADDAVEGENEEARHDPHPAEVLPGGAAVLLGGERAHGVDRAAPAAPDERDYADHDGDAGVREGPQVEQHEAAAAVLRGEVRKAPDVAEADRGARGGENDGPAAGPFDVNRLAWTDRRVS